MPWLNSIFGSGRHLGGFQQLLNTFTFAGSLISAFLDKIIGRIENYKKGVNWYNESFLFWEINGIVI